MAIFAVSVTGRIQIVGPHGVAQAGHRVGDPSPALAGRTLGLPTADYVGARHHPHCRDCKYGPPALMLSSERPTHANLRGRVARHGCARRAVRHPHIHPSRHTSRRRGGPLRRIDGALLRGDPVQATVDNQPHGVPADSDGSELCHARAPPVHILAASPATHALPRASRELRERQAHN